MSASLMIVDPHIVFAEAVRSLMEKRGDLTVMGEAADGQRAFDMARDLRPDVIVTEILLPELNGIDLIARLRQAGNRARIVVLSSRGGRSSVEQALGAGASAYVCKTDSAKELDQAIDATLDGRSYLSPAIAQHVVDAMGGRPSESGARLGDLTTREREILQLLAEGLASKEIASDLNVSTRTVDSHRARIMQKLDIHKVSGLVRFAIREGLVSA